MRLQPTQCDKLGGLASEPPPSPHLRHSLPRHAHASRQIGVCQPRIARKLGTDCHRARRRRLVAWPACLAALRRRRVVWWRRRRVAPLADEAGHAAGGEGAGGMAELDQIER